MHSFEEDRDGALVYRPAQHEFPRARGRAGLELLPDGTFIESRIGRGDANEKARGHWAMGADGSLQLTYDGAARSSRSLEVLENDPDLLRVRERHV
jgi:hypothetical protein